MVTEHLDDGEGEILARVRKVIGKDVPLVASLDLHANVTPDMVEHADALIAYRTYPHVDMAATGRACAKHLALMLQTKRRFAKAFRQLPFLIPISWQCTNDQPAKGIYQQLAALESESVPTLSFAPGFPAADFRDCGASVFAYGKTQADADAAADGIMASSRAMKTISTAGSIRPMTACATPWSWRRPQRSRSSSPTPRIIPAPAAIPTPRGCCAHWCATMPSAPQQA